MSAASELFSNLANAQTAAKVTRALHQLEDFLTPKELTALLPEMRTLSGLPLIACRSSSILKELIRSPPQPYVRRDLSDGVAFFSSTSHPQSQKSLIVAFCGRTRRPMLPWSLFLQYLPASKFDVLILADRNNDYYLAGIDGYAPSMWGLVNRVSSDVGASHYRSLFSYGTSAGGFAALRFGLLARAYRSISVGGTFPWPIHRLQSGVPVSAFDPLCACNPQPGSHLVCVHATDAERDRKNAVHLQRIMKISRVPVAGTPEHNVVYAIYQAGQLAVFNSELFDFDPQLIPSAPTSGSRGIRGQAAVRAPN